MVPTFCSENSALLHAPFSTSSPIPIYYIPSHIESQLQLQRQPRLKSKPVPAPASAAEPALFQLQLSSILSPNTSHLQQQAQIQLMIKGLVQSSY